MRAVLKLECIGDDRAKAYKRLGVPYPHPWAARLSRAGGKWVREFVRGQKNYKHANSVGSRGVFTYFALEPGVYDVFERCAWKRNRRYFLLVNKDATTVEISEKEAIRWFEKA